MLVDAEIGKPVAAGQMDCVRSRRRCRALTLRITTEMKLRHFGQLVLAGVFSLVVFVHSASADPVTDYNVAVEFYKQQRWQLASDSCEEFIKKYPMHERTPMARLYWAQALLHLKKYKEARAQFEQFLTLVPDNPDRPLAMYRVGECSYFLNDDPAVETQFTQFLKSYPQHELAEWATLYLGEAQYRQERYEAAISTFEKSLKNFPEGRLIDDVEFNLAGAYDALGQKEKAVETLKRIAGRPKGQRAADALFQLAAKSFDQRKFDEAAAAFQDLVKQHPQHRLVSNAQLNLGYAYYHLGKFTEAIPAFQMAAKDPQFAVLGTYWIGLSQKSLKGYAESAKTLADLLAAHPDDAMVDKVAFQLGDAEFRLGNFVNAIENFELVVKKWPTSDLADDALHAACEASLQAGNFQNAVQLHEQFVKAFPQSPLLPVQEILFARVKIAQGEKADSPDKAKGDYQQAEAVLNRLLNGDFSPRVKTYARFQLARVYERLEDNQKVVSTLKPLLDAADAVEQPEYLDARLLNANGYLRLKEYAAAAEQYRLYLDQVKAVPDRIVGLAGLARTLTESQSWPEVQIVVGELSKVDTQGETLVRVAVAGGDAAFDHQQWVVAQSLYQLVLDRGESSPFYLSALSGMSHSFYEEKRFADAAKSFEKLAVAAEEDAALGSHAAYMQALSLQQAGMKAEALSAYQAAIEKFSMRQKQEPLTDKESPVGMNAYRSEKGAARLSRENGDRKQADQFYQQAYDELKKQPVPEQRELDVLLNEWANLAYSAEDFARADELYTKLIAECPESPLVSEASLILGESARFSGKIDQAKETFKRLADDKNVDGFVRQRSLVHLLDLATEDGDWDQSLALAKRMKTEFTGGPHTLYAGYREAEALLKMKEYAKSSAVLEELKGILPADLSQAPAWWGEIWLMQAECYYWSKNYAALEKTLAELRAKNPAPNVVYRIDALQGRGLENQARFAAAREAYARVIDSEAGRGTEAAADCQFRIAESYLKENNLSVALREYYKVYAGYAVPRLASAALFQAASCDVSMKHYPEAMETYRKLIAEFPDSEFTDQAKARLKELEAATQKKM